MDNPKPQFVVVVGSIFTGIVIHGPFNDARAAFDWVQDNVPRRQHWHTTQFVAPIAATAVPEHTS